MLLPMSIITSTLHYWSPFLSENWKIMPSTDVSTTERLILILNPVVDTQM